ncbi:MAG: hypothetical protein WCI63_04510 [bacterium]
MTFRGGGDDGAPDIDTSDYSYEVGEGSGTPESNSDNYGDESSP